MDGMSSKLKSFSAHAVREGGYQAQVELHDGTKATSAVFLSTDDCNEWAVKFADEYTGASDHDLSPELKATTVSLSTGSGDFDVES